MEVREGPFSEAEVVGEGVPALDESRLGGGCEEAVVVFVVDEENAICLGGVGERSMDAAGEEVGGKCQSWGASETAMERRLYYSDDPRRS